MNKDEIAGLVKYARDWPGVEGDALSAGVVGQKLNDMADALATLSARVETLEAEMERRDRNENRNCINWGPRSRYDKSMSGGGDNG